ERKGGTTEAQSEKLQTLHHQDTKTPRKPCPSDLGALVRWWFEIFVFLCVSVPLWFRFLNGASSSASRRRYLNEHASAINGQFPFRYRYQRPEHRTGGIADDQSQHQQCA